LDYVERYAHAFMAAMAVKRAEGKWRELVYIDLLQGLERASITIALASFSARP